MKKLLVAILIILIVATTFIVATHYQTRRENINAEIRREQDAYDRCMSAGYYKAASSHLHRLVELQAK